MSEYELRCIYDSRKSFYNKAVVLEDEGTKKLKSYSTFVCEIKNNKPVVFGTYSLTTLRHIKEFLKQNGFKANNIKDVEGYFPTNEENEQKEKEENEKEEGLLKSVKMLCAFGDVLNGKQEDKNDFKTRMIKAGFENKGLSFPDNWDTLPEEEKTKRLNQVENIL